MDSKPEVIRQQMEETRSSLTQKLETLEQQVVSTVQDATSAVTDTVDNVKDAVHETVATVKDSVQDTVDSVRETFDVERQVQRRPWVMLGGSVALGYLVGAIVHRSTRMVHAPQERPSRAVAAYQPAMNGNRVAPAPEPAPVQADAGPSLLGQLTEQFKPELDKLKGLAIGTALGVVRDLITHSVPDQLKGQVSDMVNDVTTKLGGKPVQGQVINPETFLSKGERQTERYSSDLGRPVGAARG